MITTRRPMSFVSAGNSAVDVLERKTPDTYRDYMSEPVCDTDLEEAKARMQKNLDRIMNYEKYKDEETIETPSPVVAQSETPVIEETPAATREEDVADEDIQPTSTTMQFGDNADNAQVFNDMAKQKEEVNEGYRLNAKGKLVVALYAVAVALILTLIVLNTGVLAMLSKSNAETTARLNAAVEQYNAVSAEIDAVSSDAYVTEIAENEFGMIKK